VPVDGFFEWRAVKRARAKQPYAILDVSDSRMGNIPPRYNAAPSQELVVIRENHKTGERSLDLIKWGLIPHWCADPKGGRKPINAKAETVAALPMFSHAYARRPSTMARRRGPEL
jgi:putative SOS response-associated peptidase YedK